MTADLFDSVAEAQPSREQIADGAVLLRGFVRPIEGELVEAVRAFVLQSPFRRMTTPGGYQMSVAMTNCGERGWITDHTGYRYDPIDPKTGAPWPVMPPVFRDLARRAAEQGGFRHFAPDACLINRYEPGTRLSLHQDKDELDYSAPIVSVSLGLPATFLFGGLARADKP
ncbi:alpha-ketoglutarate-dependent dioxygenase AlkB, partial [Bradyrhizobium manausense]